MQPTRRSFLSCSLSAAATVCMSGRALGAGDRLGVAVIGVNGMGLFHVKTLTGRGDVLACGILGAIKMTKAWNCQRQENPKPVPDGDPPRGVNYDRWLGPAPKRAFNRHRFHRSWRVFRDYGNGDIGDDGAHDLDLARWGLGEATHPVKVTAHGSRVDLREGIREYPDNMTVTYEYASGKVLIYEDRQWTPYGLHG